MENKAYIYINYNNIVVLQSYLDVIKDALSLMGYMCEYTKDLKSVDKQALIVHPMGIDAFKYYFKGYHNFILWQQGATADESFMRNHSKLRYWMLNKMDLFAMKKAKAILYVSKYMKEHYEKMGGCLFSDKSYIMPCFNEEYDDSIYAEKDYSKKTFTYVGSLDLWQCFEQTTNLYKQIEDAIPEARLKVLTFDTANAERIIKEKGIKHYEVKCVPKDEVKKELSFVNYGFIIREDNMVNRVATPTKISSYMSAGVIPIFSTCLKDFSALAQNLKYAKAVENLDEEGVADVICFIKKTVDKEDVKEEYRKVFESYYGKQIHCKNLETLLKKVL